MSESNIEKEITQPVFEWSTKSSATRKKRDIVWYTIIILFAAILSLIFYKLQIYSAVILVAVALLYILVSSKVSQKSEYKIFNDGILVGKRVYSFGEFKQFGIIQSNPTKIYLSKAGIIPTLVTLTLNADIFDNVFQFISKKLPQGQDHKEDIVDIINRLIKI